MGLSSRGVLVVLGLGLALSSCAPAESRSATLALRGASVVDVRGGSLLPDRTVLVEGDRIVAVGPVDEVTVPDDAQVVDAAGGYLIPGLWDMHVHAARAGRAPRFWPLFLAYGVTGVREMGSVVDSLLHWRAGAERPASLAPRVHWSSPMLDGEPPVLDFAVAVPDAEAARAVVDSMDELGFDVLKVYERLPREAYFALAEEARRRGIPFAGHVPLAVDPLEASDAGQKSFEHAADVVTACIPEGRGLFRASGGVGGIPGSEPSEAERRAMERLIGAMAFSEPDPALCGPLLDRLATNGTWFTPTLAQSRGRLRPASFEGDPRLRAVPAEVLSAWRRSRGLGPEEEIQVGQPVLDNILTVVGMAHRAGVGILAGTDASDEPYVFAGSSLHDELELLAEAGLTPAEALRTATVNPARALGRSDDLGTVEEGKLADLVLLEGNPLEDIRATRQIRAVVADGRLLDREALDGMLAEAAGAVQE